MKIVTEKNIVDADINLILMVFKNDEERKQVIKHLQNMEDSPGERGYAMYPNGKYTADYVRQFAEAFLCQR